MKTMVMVASLVRRMERTKSDEIDGTVTGANSEKILKPCFTSRSTGYCWATETYAIDPQGF